MIGTTLLDIADHIESLASEDGEFSLVCARYGDRPVPAAGLRFDSRETARAAARATEQYRDALRRYDPELPFYDVVVRQEFAEPPSRSTGRDDGARTPVPDDAGTFAPDDGESPPDQLTDRIVDGAARRRRGGDGGRMPELDPIPVNYSMYSTLTSPTRKKQNLSKKLECFKRARSILHQCDL